VIIPRLFPAFLTNGVAEILQLSLDEAKGLTKEELVKLAADRQRKLASAFREHMTEGQTEYASNSYRREFYRDVTVDAEEVNFLPFPVLVRMTFFTSL
jgi:hypothetical protein